MIGRGDLGNLRADVIYMAECKVMLSPTVAPCDVAKEILDEYEECYTTDDKVTLLDTFVYRLAKSVAEQEQT
jgi:hypothetical protein